MTIVRRSTPIALLFTTLLTTIGPALAGETSSLRDRLAIDVVRAEDLSAIKKLQRAYGYYADRGRWDALADLFTSDATANYPSGGFDGNASIRAMFVQNLGQGKAGLADGRLYNHTILQPVVDLAPDGATATGRWRVLGMLGRYNGSATWADSLYRFDYVKQDGHWRIRTLVAYAGSGGGYDQGWVAPKPRPPGAADTSPIRFNLAHPADRPWIDPCEADVSACVVPFPYPNRGSAPPAGDVTALIGSAPTAAELVVRAQRLDDEQALLNLQRTYGYHVDRGDWRAAAALFAADGTREVGQGGVYVGRDHIRRALALTAPEGLKPGQLNDHLQVEPIIDVAPDGRTASGRVFELAFTGGGSGDEPARLVQNVAENTYVKRGRNWQIQAMHVYTILVTDARQGWGKSALPAPMPSASLPPDRPPSVAYQAYPSVFTPPFHFDDVTRSAPAFASSAVPEREPSSSVLATADRQVQRVLDAHAIDNLQAAYGYYAEKALWSEIAPLFTPDGVLEIDGARHAGRERILAQLKASGPEGPVKGALDSQLQLQPVIVVAADGRSATMRSRLLQLTRDAQGRPQWGGGIYESDLVNERGVWKYRRLRFSRTWLVDYQRGWAEPGRSAVTRAPPLRF